MKHKGERLLQLTEQLLVVLEEKRECVVRDGHISPQQKEGRMETLTLIERFCKDVRREIVSRNWPARSVRRSRLASMMRAISNIGWYCSLDDDDADIVHMMNLFENARKLYRRLPEID